MLLPLRSVGLYCLYPRCNFQKLVGINRTNPKYGFSAFDSSGFICVLTVCMQTHTLLGGT